tara:strand:+ start:8329 stop:8565 length:237 start_codon:yes stop_codon:yes gene_type:complete
MTNKIILKDCQLYINDKLVCEEDELIRMASMLTTGSVPPVLEVYGLEEGELMNLESMLSKSIFVKGECLTPDDEYLEE